MSMDLIYTAPQNGRNGLVSRGADVSVVTASSDQLFFLGLALPYVKQPASDPVFETFFTKQWVDNYTTSLHNFLATIFQNMRKSHQTTWSSLLLHVLSFLVQHYQAYLPSMSIEHNEKPSRRKSKIWNQLWTTWKQWWRLGKMKLLS